METFNSKKNISKKKVVQSIINFEKNVVIVSKILHQSCTQSASTYFGIDRMQVHVGNVLTCIEKALITCVVCRLKL